MSSSPPPSPDNTTDLQKEPSRAPPTPPPAYFPRVQYPLPTNTSAHLAARFAGQQPPRLPPRYAVPMTALPHPLPLHLGTTSNRWYNAADYGEDGQSNNTNEYEDAVDDDDDGDDDDNCNGGRSAITIHISTTLRVSGDNNIICLDGNHSPAENARLIAEAVTTTIRQGGEQEVGGIPMIDEEGRPRPIRVEIEAGVEVQGGGNVLGGKDIVLRALDGRRGWRGEERGRREEDIGQRRTRGTSI